MGLPRVQVTGTPPESGTAYGVAAGEMIRANLDAYRRRFRDQAGLDAAAVRAAGEAFRAGTVAYHPRIATMLDGVAAGAGVAPAELYALNARTELLYDRRAGAAGGVPPPAECTAIGVLGTHTATGHLLLAQNWDWYPDQREAILVLDTTDERGHRVVTMAEAGMLAKAGLNSAGVGQCLTLLGCERDGLTDPPGVAYHVLARATLEADSLTGAVRAACRSPRNASINLLLGRAGAADQEDPARGGELLDLELVPGAAGWLHPTGGLLTHANHLESRLPVHDVQQDLGNSSLWRSARARRLMTGPVTAGQTTLDDLAAVLRDHADHPHGICRHLDERDPPLDRTLTACSVLMDLDARRFGITDGPPCQAGYTWWELTG